MRKMTTIIACGFLLTAPLLVNAAAPADAPTRTTTAGDGAGGCGWGSALFDGNSGVGAHIFAMTTNGSFGNATFGMSSGTIGCDPSQPIRYKGGRVYISANMTKLAEDMSRGQGETLAGLSEVMGIAQADKPAFYALTKKHFDLIYPNELVTSDQVMDSLVVVLKSDPALSKYVS
ncbi:MAG TPA: DUF3015 family protein [Methylococcaceae bacterium]|jgi:hypothetical protein|nr:DUF3015 family protein [Methylococcaceae bacterium]